MNVLSRDMQLYTGNCQCLIYDWNHSLLLHIDMYMYLDSLFGDWNNVCWHLLDSSSYRCFHLAFGVLGNEDVPHSNSQ